MDIDGRQIPCGPLSACFHAHYTICSFLRKLDLYSQARIPELMR